jgi:hypothetical protein
MKIFDKKNQPAVSKPKLGEGPQGFETGSFSHTHTPRISLGEFILQDRHVSEKRAPVQGKEPKDGRRLENVEELFVYIQSTGLTKNGRWKRIFVRQHGKMEVLTWIIRSPGET